ncbi:MAG: ral secretion pathway protein GspK [Paucimonas sp.]|jgi:general secretion pathway protein K|nr:ral secretion pathway protein GspK [Paucimonas sp.]
MKRRISIRQRGVAIVTALLLTTLAVTIVASLFWQQQVQVRSIENQRLQLQKLWILRGAMDYAQLIVRNDDPTFDSLDDIWAVPLAETKLDQYLEQTEANVDASDAALWGDIVDAQSLFNIGNLIKSDENGFVIDQDQLKTFQTLLGILKIDPALADETARTMKSIYTANGAGMQEMPLSRLEDLLTIKGFTPTMIEKLRKFAVILDVASPEPIKININTAPVEVIAAGLGTLSLLEPAAWMHERKRGGYIRNQGFFDDVGNKYNFKKNDNYSKVFSFKTDYFLINGTVRMSHASLKVQALVRRGSERKTSDILWIRQA